MTSNRVSKPTPMLRCAQIKGAPWLEISKIGTAPSCLWIAGGGGGGALGWISVGVAWFRAAPERVGACSQGSLHLAGLVDGQSSLGPVLVKLPPRPRAPV